MEYKKLYIQQLKYDGVEYTKGLLKETLHDFKIACRSFPFKVYSESKPLAGRDWLDEDGRDVYVPDKVPMKEYDIDVEFIFNGSDEQMRANLVSFMKFLYGRNENGSGRLAIYDDFTETGRKDVRVKSVDDDIFEREDGGNEAVFTFKVKFEVNDPVTEVGPDSLSQVTELVWPYTRAVEE